MPHSAPAPDSETRSLPRVTLASDHPWPRAPTRCPAGSRTSSRKTSLKVWVAGHVDERPHRDPGGVHGADEVGDALVLGGVGLGAGQQDPEVGQMGVGGPHLLTLHHPLVAVELGPGGQRGQVGPGAGLAEQLAPDLLAGQQREQVALLLLVGAGVDEGRAGPSDADGVVGPPDPGPPQLVVDDQLWVGSAPRPHGRGQCGATSPASASWRAVGIGVSAEPVAGARPARVVLAGSARSTAASVGCTGSGDRVGPVAERRAAARSGRPRRGRSDRG